MIRRAYDEGTKAALARYKVANAVMGYGPGAAPGAAMTGMAGGSMGAASATVPKSPQPPAMPAAAGAPKASVLG